MKVLVLNCGSSSLKCQLIDMEKNERIMKGHYDRIGGARSSLRFNVRGEKTVIEHPARDFEEAIGEILNLLISDEYKVVTRFLMENISKDNDLVFGCANRGLMGICYNEFLKNNRKITGVCYEMYKSDLEGLKLDEVHMVKTLEESNRFLEENADIILILPGAFGTLSEFIDILEHKRTKLHNKEMIIFNINGFYDDLINMFNKIYKKVSNDYDFNSLCKVFNTALDVTNYIEENN